MAEKRMYAKSIVKSDMFLDMPLSSQALYFHLGMEADDDGFINNPKMIMRVIGANQNDLDLLVVKKFVLPFESGIVVIKHWKINNYIQKDRYTPTKYHDLMNELEFDENKSYRKKELCIHDGYTLDTQYRLDKIRLDKNSIKTIGQNDLTVDVSNDELFNQFWNEYPKKVGKDKCKRWFNSHKVNQEFVDDILIAIRNQKQSSQWQKDKGQFIPHPYTWLNRGGWQDELDGNPAETIKNRWGEFLDD